MADKSHNFTYDVFLSFRGKDYSRDTFIGDLREELNQKGIRTFIDDDDDQRMLNEEDNVSSKAAIEDSKVLVVVFSENYAGSTRCLDEVYNINSRRDIEGNQQQQQQQHVFPIFYHVEPTIVRHQNAKYGAAMVGHEKRFGKNSEKVRTWRSALKSICDLSGHHITTPGSETDFVKKIVSEIYDKTTSKRLPAEDTVGLEQRIEEVKSLLDMKANDDNVCMLGIYGLGGIGKTQLAKALYNNIVDQFEAACFLPDVRESSNKINGLEGLQKKLLSEMSEVLEKELGSTRSGIYEIRRRLRHKRILLVLDDLDDREQLNNLAGGCEWFGLGSRIIITTRDENLLHHPVTKSYKMVELNDKQSLELFCQNAFQKSLPEIGYEDLSSRAISYAKGLPLALKVIGSDLFTQKSKEDWEHVLEEYKMIKNESIQHVLKISYERLEPNAKQVFLDIACFFKGERKKYLEKILEELYAVRHIEALVRKSLLTIEDGCLNMHDLIQDMGREIVRQEAPSNPGKRSRLWSHEDVIEVLTQNLGSDAIEGVMLDPPKRKEVEWSGIAFEKMKSLRILIIRNTSFSSEPKDLPNHLRVLDWEGYPSKSFPSRFNPKKIIIFNLRGSKLTLEKPFQKLSSLITMNFSDSESITAMPSVSEVPNLIEIRLDHCKNLIKVDESVGLLQNLAHLSASGCAKLRYFPQSMHSTSLEVLDLNLCISLAHFPDIKNTMEKKDKKMEICMINTAIEKLPDSIGNLTNLVCIEMTGSKKLSYLPDSLFMLPRVVTFKFGRCSSTLGESFRRFAHRPASANSPPSILKKLYIENGGLSDEDLQEILICFPKLQELIASDNNFVSLPECIKESAHLTSLDVSDCRELRKIPECTSLRILTVHRCMNLEEISELPSTIQKVDARYCCSLTRETLDMLWSQVKKETRGLEVVMHPTKIPTWFDLKVDGGNPRLWARGKFPIIALALYFSKMEGKDRESRRQLVELNLAINGQRVSRKGSYNFRMEAEHVLVCDLRLLFSEEEWHGLDARMLPDWNLVQVLCEASSTMTLSSWGIHVYKQETKMEDVQLICPGPEYYSDISSPPAVPSRYSDDEQYLRKMAEELGLDYMFDGVLEEVNMKEPGDDFEDKYGTFELLNIVKSLSDEAKRVIEGKGFEHDSSLEWVLRTIRKSEEERIAREEGSSSSQQGIPYQEQIQRHRSQHQEEKVMEKFFENGIRDGLVEAQNMFPTLDIDTIMVATLNKVMTCQLPQLPEFVVETPERKIYIEGMIYALQEAELSFPTLDIAAVVSVVLGMEKEKMMKIIWKGMRDGLVEAQNMFPSLDIDTIMVATYDKGKVYKLLPFPAEFEEEVTPDMKTYIEGMINALQEAKLSFPTLDVRATMDSVFRKRDHEEMNVREVIKDIFSAGMWEGLVEAQKSFPALDIDTTLIKFYTRFEGTLLPGVDIENPEAEMIIFKQGIIKGLQEAKMSFPALNVEATLSAVLQ